MTDMSVSMILKLVDGLSGPAKDAESAAARLKRELQSFNELRAGPTAKDWVGKDKEAFDRAREALIARRKEAINTEKVELEAARAVQAAERAKGESAATAASQIVAANEKIVASEQRTVAAIEKSTAQQAAAAASLQRQRSAAYLKAERDREAAAASLQRQRSAAYLKAERDREIAARRERQEQEHIAREQRRHGAANFLLGGAASAVGAHAIWHRGKSMIEAGAERQHIETKAINAGIPASEIPRIQAASREAKRGAPNMSISEIEELFTEARSAVKHPEETFHILNDLARAGSVLRGMGVDNSGLALIVKAAESLGRMNSPEQFKTYLDGQVKAMQVFGKTITPEQIYEAAKYSKAAGGTLSDRFINMTMPSLIQELRGSSAGDALSMAVRTLRGKLDHRSDAARMLNDLGLVEEPDKIRRNKAGKITGYGGKLKGDALIATDFDQWVWKVLKPAMEAKGLKSQEDKNAFLDKALPPQAANLVRVLLQQQEAIEQHQRNLEAAADAQTAAANQAKEAASSFTALTKSISDLNAAATQGAMPTIAAGLGTVTGWINQVAETAAKFPKTAATLTAGALTAALGGSGVLAYKIYQGFGLTASATALNGSAAALTAAAARLGAGNPLKDVPKVVPTPPVTPVTPIPLVGAGLGAGAGIAGGTLVGIGAAALTAGVIMDNKYGGAPGHRPWTIGRIWDNFSGGGDTMPTHDEISANLDKTVAAKSQSVQTTLQLLNGLQVTPDVDSSKLDLAATKSKEFHAELQRINDTYTPKIDLSAFDAAIAKAQQLRQVLGGLGGGRHSFSPSSGGLHDGYEAR